MTMEITDPDIWEAIEKGEITGFSMGGVGVYGEKDVQLENAEREQKQNEKKGVFKKMAELLGFDVVEKGQFQEKYDTAIKASNFWQAFDTLSALLWHWDYYSDASVFESDTEKITEALSEFSNVIQSVLTGGSAAINEVAKSKPVEKAGKKISGANREKLQTAYEALGALLEAVAEPEESEEKAEPENNETGKENQEEEEEEKALTKQEIEQVVHEAVAEEVKKAMGEQQTTEQPEVEIITKEDVQEIVQKAVSEAVTPLLKTRGVPSAMNEGGSIEQTAENHYLHGIL